MSNLKMRFIIFVLLSTIFTLSSCKNDTELNLKQAVTETTPVADDNSTQTPLYPAGNTYPVIETCTIPTMATVGTYTLTSDLTYVTHAGSLCGPSTDNTPNCRLDLYKPNTPAETNKPLMVLIHGGGWVSGSKAQMANNARLFVSLGYNVAVINYRLATLSGLNQAPAAMQDVRCAIQYLRNQDDNLGINATKIVTLGTSAGAHLSLYAGVTGSKEIPELENSDCAYSNESAEIQGVVASAPPVDVGHIGWFSGTDTAPATFLGTAMGPSTQSDFASPYKHVDQSTPPMFITHGDADTVVYVPHSRLMYETLVAADRPRTYMEVVGGTHTIPLFSSLTTPNYKPVSCTMQNFLSILSN